MTRILKYQEHSNWEEIAKDFLYEVQNPIISESEENGDDLTSHIKNIFNRFGFNLELVFTFGTGVKFMFPIVSKLVENMQLEVVPTKEDVVLLCITILSIIYLRYKKEPLISDEDIKNKLNGEIKLKFGNPRSIVNKLLKCFEHIFLFIKKFPRLFGVAVSDIIDMFSYTSILIPVMNAIGTFCSKYELTPDNLLGNLASLGVGIMTISSKNLYDYLKNKIKGSKGNELDEPDHLSDPDEFDLGSEKLIQEQ
jgi:hypothetical protein